MKHLLVSLSALLLIVACGGGKPTSTTSVTPPVTTSTTPPPTPPAPPAPPPPSTVPARVVVIGNSITYHAPDASLGWTGSWGMAATTQDKDFAHVVAQTLNLPVTPLNLAGLESNPAGIDTYLQQVSDLKIDNTTIVVVELGDNVPADGLVPDFEPAYEKLLTLVSARAKLACVSTFWTKPGYDAFLKSACESAGGKLAYIGDVDNDPNNPDYTSVDYSNSGVQIHPHDWGMNAIAQSVLNALAPIKPKGGKVK